MYYVKFYLFSPVLLPTYTLNFTRYYVPGVGIVLVAVSGVAWRLTSQQAPSCRAMLGLGGDDSGGEPNRRFVPRLPPSYGRPHHPYAGNYVKDLRSNNCCRMKTKETPQKILLYELPMRSRQICQSG